MIGTAISHYRVPEKMGAGGMGVVYKAQDTRLGRFVALKFLPEDYADDQQLREHSQRKARATTFTRAVDARRWNARGSGPGKPDPDEIV